MKFSNYLKSISACPEAIAWVGDRTLAQAWAECQRGDWLVWLAARTGASHQQLVLCAATGAESVAHLADDDSACAVAWAIDVARRWVRGEADAEECEAARAAANDAYDAYAYDAAAAAAAANAAAYAAATATATDAAAAAAYYAAYYAATDVVRAHLACPRIEGVE